MVHKWTHSHSILSVVAAPSKNYIICGTQDSKILIFDVTTFALKYTIDCGRDLFSASVLCLAIEPEENYLFSAGSDSLVKVWDLTPLASPTATGADIRCTHLIYLFIDIGDIFSISWSAPLSTIFIGAQNASLSWCQLDLSSPRPTVYTAANMQSSESILRLPHLRFDKFFDSKGPGGSVNDRQCRDQAMRTPELQVESKGPAIIEIPSANVVNFAHNGYVYCMQFLSHANSPEFCDLHKGLYENFLISCGGDGVIKIWGVSLDDLGSITLDVFAALDNEEAILSMYVLDSSIYVGLSDSSINSWDLTTLQSTRSFHFTSDSEKQNEEILSLCIHDGCIYKASNAGGLCKFRLKQDITDDEEHSSAREFSWNLNFDQLLKDNLIEVENNSVFVVQTFEHRGSKYLISGGAGSLCLWNLSDTLLSSDSLDLPGLAPIEPNKEKFAHGSNTHMLESLKRFISYKTVSRYPRLYLEESRQCARFLGKTFMNMGASETKLLPIPNCNPVIFAKFERNNPQVTSQKPVRVLWYGHYDVVNASQDKDCWVTDPFKLTAKDGNLYARGVSDNKGPVLAALFAVAELHANKELSTDVVFLIEGEEECGSMGFQDTVNANKQLIGDIDFTILSNSYWLDDDIPCLNYGLRGVVNASVSVESEKPDRHSGVDGGVSKEPTMDLIQILGQLSCPSSNKIQIPGFYDLILPIQEDEVKLFEKVKQSKKGSGITDADLDQLWAKWRNPSLTVHRLDVSGPNNNTVISQRAKASLSIRVVPGQELQQIKKLLVLFLTTEFQKLNTDNKLSIDIFHEAEPWLGDPKNAVYKLLYEKMKKAWGPSVQDPLLIREGGSIPSIRFLEKAFNAPAAQIPCGQGSDNAHLKNEKLRIINLFKLRDILEGTFRELGLH